MPASVEEILKVNVASQRDDAIRLFITQAEKDLAAGYKVIIGGDLNEPSHCDWIEKNKDMTINEAQDQVIEEFSDFDDWMDKYQLLIDLGNEQQPLDEKYKTEQNLIEGCQSRVWLKADEIDGKVVFQAESDALIVKGIIALLIKVVSGHTPDEILNSDLYFIEKIGLKEHLSPTRSNGLLAMVKQMRMYALAFKAKTA